MIFGFRKRVYLYVYFCLSRLDNLQKNIVYFFPTRFIRLLFWSLRFITIYCVMHFSSVEFQWKSDSFIAFLPHASLLPTYVNEIIQPQKRSETVIRTQQTSIRTKTTFRRFRRAKLRSSWRLLTGTLLLWPSLRPGAECSKRTNVPTVLYPQDAKFSRMNTYTTNF